MRAKVLIACPTSDVKDYCAEEYFENLRKIIEFTEKKEEQVICDVLICDNTKGGLNEKIFDLADDFCSIIWENPEGLDSIGVINNSYKAIRTYFLSENYSHLMIIESDLIPPRESVIKLLEHNKKVVGFPYFIFDNSLCKPMIQSIGTKALSLGESYQLNPEEAFLEIDGTLKECYAMGFGCVLINRKVVNKINFRCKEDEFTKGKAHSDSFFYADLFREGIKAYLDTSITIEHLNNPRNIN